MRNASPASIDQVGENIIESWLLNNEYTDIIKESISQRNSILKAHSRLQNILLQVKTFRLPQRPYKLSEYEIDKLVRRALNADLVAYVAYVVVDDNDQLAEEIAWERLTG